MEYYNRPFKSTQILFHSKVCWNERKRVSLGLQHELFCLNYFVRGINIINIRCEPCGRSISTLLAYQSRLVLVIIVVLFTQFYIKCFLSICHIFRNVFLRSFIKLYRTKQNTNNIFFKKFIEPVIVFIEA